MNKQINYLGFLSTFSLIGVIGFFNRDQSHVFTFFAFLSYIGYFFVIPDELFVKRLYQAASVTLIVTFLLMVSLFVGYLLSQNVNFFTNGFWISFTIMIVTFPIVFTIFQVKDTSDI